MVNTQHSPCNVVICFLGGCKPSALFSLKMHFFKKFNSCQKRLLENKKKHHKTNSCIVSLHKREDRLLSALCHDYSAPISHSCFHIHLTENFSHCPLSRLTCSYGAARLPQHETLDTHSPSAIPNTSLPLWRPGELPDPVHWNLNPFSHVYPAYSLWEKNQYKWSPWLWPNISYLAHVLNSTYFWSHGPQGTYGGFQGDHRPKIACLILWGSGPQFSSKSQREELPLRTII